MTITGSDPALTYSILSSANRLGNTRLGYHASTVFIWVGGFLVASAAASSIGVLRASLTITDALGDRANTATFTLFGITPVEGQSVVIKMGSSSAMLALFSGSILSIEQVNDDAGRIFYHVHCIDATWRLNRRKVSRRYVGASATAIASDIIGSFTTGFSYALVAPGLMVVDEITFINATVSAALSELATRIGGYWYVDYNRVVHFYIVESIQAPSPLVPGHATLSEPTATKDLSQIVTRAHTEGGGVSSLAQLSPGETLIPVEDLAWYDQAGGLVQIGAQRVTYAGVRAGGAGALVGPGVTPTAAPRATVASGSGIDAGTHAYGFTWVTAAGETTISPVTAAVLHGAVAAPTLPPAVFNDTSNFPSDEAVTGAWDNGNTVEWRYSWGTDAGPALGTIPSPSTSIVAVANGAGSYYHSPSHPSPLAIHAGWYYSTDARVTRVFLWHRVNSGPWYVWGDIVNAIPNVPAGGVPSFIPALYSPVFFVTSGVTTPVANPNFSRTAIAGLATGPIGTTGRKIYRTAAGGSVLKLLTTVADNSSVSYTDSAADSTLGAVPPIADTSGLALGVENGGGFYASSSIVFPTDGAATVATSAAPVFTSASYSFVAADVGAVLYIKSGTNWIAGRYRIVSVGSGAATLDAACASVASPTSGTWGVDYSAGDGARYLYSDLVIGATNTTFTSAANPVGKNLIGNVLNVRDGVGFIRQRVIVISTSGTTATADKVLGTASSSGGSGNLGGAASGTVVPAGSTTLLLANALSFQSTGGWAEVNGQVLRYTGISGNRLTGLPAAGVGAIVNAIAYEASVRALPVLTGVPASGVGALVDYVLQGDDIHVLVMVEDAGAQATLAALVGDGDDGIAEDFESDNQASRAECRARGLARLSLLSAPLTTLRYQCRDKITRSGAFITVDLPSPVNLATTLIIQQVTISRFSSRPDVFPTYDVEASSSRFSIDDLIRRERTR